MPLTTPAERDAAVDAAVKILRAGGLVVFPTDTVYGLAACPTTEGALERIYTIKGRKPDKPIARLAADPEQVEIAHPRLLKLAERHWPGPLTLVVDGVGYRVPDHELARALIRAFGAALPTTSANRSGEPDALTAEAALLALPEVDLILDGGTTPGQIPSTVVGVTDGAATDVEDPMAGLVVFREGAIAKETLLGE